MTALGIACLLSVLAYIAESLLFVRGLRRSAAPIPSGDEPTNWPPITVLVAARNEASNITYCLESLLRLDYPADRLQILVINDASTDDTGALIDRLIAQNPGRLTRLDTAPSDGMLRGKANAVACGMDHATGEIALVTDADCAVRPTWAKATVRPYLADSQLGLVGGVTLNEPNGQPKVRPPWFYGMQALDSAYLMGLAAGAVANGRPLSCIGNNLSFRRAAYEAVGGYRGIPFSVTEDFALFRAILKRTAYTVRYPVDPATTNRSRPLDSVGELYRQRKRWARGGLDIDIDGYMVLIIAFLAHLSVVVAPWALGPLIAVGLLVVKCAGDALVLWTTLRLLGRTDLLRHFAIYEVYYFAYVVLLPFVLLFDRHVEWKGRRYS